MELGLHLDAPVGLPADLLVPAATRVDAAVRERIATALLPVVGAWCVRMGGPAVDPEEAAHDVIMTVLRRLPDLRPGSAIEPWAYGITRHVVRAHRRRAWVRRWVPDAVVEAVSGDPSPARRAEMNQTAAQVQRVLERLPEIHREVIVLCDVEERSRSEVAALIGIPEGTVKSRLRLAREQFRRQAEGLGYTFAEEVVVSRRAGTSSVESGSVESSSVESGSVDSGRGEVDGE